MNQLVRIFLVVIAFAVALYYLVPLLPPPFHLIVLIFLVLLLILFLLKEAGVWNPASKA